LFATKLFFFWLHFCYAAFFFPQSLLPALPEANSAGRKKQKRGKT
jgi:hypothetical protein